jgi:mRNA interferase MazF
LDWHPARGSEQAGRRPSLVVSNDTANRVSPVVIVAAITARPPRRPYPVNVGVPTGLGTGLDRESTVLCSQLLTVSKDRLERYVGSLPPDVMRRVDDALAVALGLP